MEILIGVIVVAALGAVAFFILRGSAPPPKELPPGGDAHPPPGQAPPAEGPRAGAAEPAREVGSGSPQPTPEAPAAEAESAEAEERESEAAGTPAPTPSKPTAEDMAALKKGLKTTRSGFITRLAKLFGKKKEIDPELIDEIEEVLIGADLGTPTTRKILTRLREQFERDELSDVEGIWEAIRSQALEILGGSHGDIRVGGDPAVILVVGVNGVGKTTTIGKLASRLKDDGKQVILAAGDTFRAAAVLQLEVWGRRVGCAVVKGKERADPGSVIFDAVKKAREVGADVVIADTAGRLHTKVPLMEELKKVHRTVEKALGGRAADEVLLVLDSTNGQNAIQQAQMFKDALPVTGIVLTKLDGTAKGGVILGIADEHGLPVRFIGIGERVEDLRRFDAPSFVAALFEKPDEESLAA